MILQIHNAVVCVTSFRLCTCLHLYGLPPSVHLRPGIFMTTTYLVFTNKPFLVLRSFTRLQL